MSTVDDRFDMPLYTLAEAARALDVPPATFQTWSRGYVRHRSDGADVHGDAILSDFRARPGEATVPFIGLAEGFVLAGIRKQGVPLQRIRPALSALQRELGLKHALASQRLYTDGAEIRLRDVDGRRECARPGGGSTRAAGVQRGR